MGSTMFFLPFWIMLIAVEFCQMGKMVNLKCYLLSILSGFSSKQTIIIEMKWTIEIEKH